MIYGTVNFAARIELEITDREFLLCDIINKLAYNPRSNGWAWYKNEDYARLFGISERAVQKMKKKLIEEELLEKKSPGSIGIKTTVKFYDATQKYRDINLLKAIFEQNTGANSSSPLHEPQDTPSTNSSSPLHEPQDTRNSKASKEHEDKNEPGNKIPVPESPLNGKKEGKTAKKKPGGWTGEYLEEFKKCYLELTGVEYIESKKDFGNMPYLRKKIARSFENSQGVKPQDFKHELKLLGIIIRMGYKADSFFRKNPTIALANGRFNEILLAIKNHNTNNHGIDKDQIRRVVEKLTSEGY